MSVLDRYKKKPEKGEDPPEQEDGYVAFYAVSEAQSPPQLTIRRRGDHMYHDPSYSYLMDVVYDGLKGREVALIFTTFVAKLRGRNLQELVKHLHFRKLDWVQEFDPARWAKPEDTAALIEQIEIYTQEEAARLYTSPKTQKSV